MFTESDELSNRHQKLLNEINAARTGINEKYNLSDTYEIICSPEKSDTANFLNSKADNVLSNKTIKPFQDINNEFMKRRKAGSVFASSNMLSVPESGLKFPIRKKAKIKFFDIFINVMFIFFLICNATIAVLMNLSENGELFGYSTANVITWSLQTEIPQGSMILIKKTDPGNLKIGDDIICVKDSNTNVTQRITGITENFDNTGARGFKTGGIDNDGYDLQIVPAVNVIGKVVWQIPYIGNGLAWLGEHFIISFSSVAGIMLFAVFMFGTFKKILKKTENSGKN